MPALSLSNMIRIINKIVLFMSAANTLNFYATSGERLECATYAVVNRRGMRVLSIAKVVMTSVEI